MTTVLERARGGDDRAFGELTAPYARELHLHCYRMLGSVTDADDVLQEILLAAWTGLSGFAERSSLRTWLYRIATNRCLNAIRDGKRRPPTEPLPPFDPPEPTQRGDITWLQPYPDTWLEDHAVRRETVELAFVTALQRLPPRQTATLVLVDVLGFTMAEVAQMMDTTQTAIKGALQRARASVGSPRDADLARSAGNTQLPALGERPDTAGEWAVARRFAEAFVADDIEAVTDLLTDDAWLAMPPAPHEYQGPAAIAAFLHASAAGRRGARVRLDPSPCNHQPGFRCYFLTDDHPPRYAGRFVLTISEDRITRITRFLDPALE
ncbi:RNA polymerase subunit sigma-70 [Kribbella sp. NPDC051770]|uniref:RNA polymerase subunit sigma-70 n=1 Tax=Kribbella sp. NPDC051770 TaxID=3155413 RepID=UPI00343A3F6B